MKLYFLYHVDYVYPTHKYARHNSNYNLSFSALDCLLLLRLTLVRPNLCYASTVWNSAKPTDAIKLQCIQRTS
jgi:hypothetical protein